jgi:hypothetical protein
MNIVDPILFQCRVNADQPAICAPGARLKPVTYAQLEYMLNSLTRAVLQFGFKPGDIVGVLLNNKIFHVILTLALVRIGLVTVSCRDRSLPKELDATAVSSICPAPLPMSTESLSPIPRGRRATDRRLRQALLPVATNCVGSYSPRAVPEPQRVLPSVIKSCSRKTRGLITLGSIGGLAVRACFAILV